MLPKKKGLAQMVPPCKSSEEGDHGFNTNPMCVQLTNLLIKGNLLLPRPPHVDAVVYSFILGCDYKLKSLVWQSTHNQWWESANIN